MKKLILTLSAAMMLAAPFCKAQDEDKKVVEFTLVPRLEASIAAPPQEGENAFTFDNNMLWSNLNINISDHFSFFMQNKWVTSCRGGDENKYFGGTKELYGKTTDFITFCYLEANVGGFTFHLGKESAISGLFEYDPYDYDVHTDLVSSFWNEFCCYQFGGSVAYTIPSETNTFTIQALSSPAFSEAPFYKGLMSYNASWACDYDVIEARLAYNAVQTNEDNRKEFLHLVTAGVMGHIGDVSIGLDYINNVGASNAYGTTLIPTVTYSSPSEKWEIGLRGLYEAETEKNWKLGAVAHWYPFTKDSWMRVSLTSGYDSALNSYIGTIGANFYIGW